MKGLLVKDLRLLLSQSRFYIILLIVLFVAGTSTQATFVSGYIAVVFPMFAVSTISYDEYDNGNAFLFTLPFSRKEYVLAKYIFGLLLCVFGSILGTSLVVIQGIMTHSLDMEMMISSQFGTILSSVLVLSIMFPLQFKFGAEKSRVALIAVIGSIFFIVTVGVKIIEKLNVELSWLNVLWNNDYLLLGVLAFIVILFIIFSIKMSMKIMLKKEL